MKSDAMDRSCGTAVSRNQLAKIAETQRHKRHRRRRRPQPIYEDGVKRDITK